MDVVISQNEEKEEKVLAEKEKSASPKIITGTKATSTMTGSADEYRQSIKKLIDSAVKSSFDEELRRATQEIQEEQRRAVKELIEEQRSLVRKLVEEEKKAIWAKIEETKKSVVAGR